MADFVKKKKNTDKWMFALPEEKYSSNERQLEACWTARERIKIFQIIHKLFKSWPGNKFNSIHIWGIEEDIVLDNKVDTK